MSQSQRGPQSSHINQRIKARSEYTTKAIITEKRLSAVNLKDHEINDESKQKQVVTKIRSPIGDIKKTRTFINPHQDDSKYIKELKEVAPLNLSRSPELEKHLKLEISVQVQKQPSVACVSSQLVQALRKPTRVEKKDSDFDNDSIPRLDITEESDDNQANRMSIQNFKNNQSDRKAKKMNKKSFQYPPSENVKEDDDQLNDSSELQETNCTSQRHRKSNSNYQTSSLNTTIPNNQTNNSSPYGIDQNYYNQSHKLPFKQNKKQQEIKASSISNKRLIQTSDNESSKPVVELELNLSMSNVSRFGEHHLKNVNLRSIDVRNNKIGHLPEELFKLPHLWKFQLDQNQIETIPDMFEGLKDLKVFTISQNLIGDIPQSLFREGTLLEKFDCSSNKVRRLPDQMGNAIHLKCLYLQDNRISELPTSLHHCQKLFEFGIEWFMYIGPQHHKIIKRLDLDQSHNCQILKILKIFSKFPDQEQLHFFDFIRAFYEGKDLDQLINGLKLGKKQSMLHLMSRCNHYHLFDSLRREFKSLIDINNLDAYGNSSLQIAIEHKNVPMIERILREFREKLKLVDTGEESLVKMNTSKKHMPLLHPLILAVKKQMIEYAIRILKIIENSNSRQIYLGHFDFNFTDDNQNTLFHFIFQNFSANTDLNVELCQKLLNLSERCQESVLNINSLNKFGQSPIDVAIEHKQNQALEFAIYYNKNQLPGCTSAAKNQKFDLNNSLNSRQITPLHRAIVAQNYRAIYLLLSSNECQVFQKDKDYRSARDYCQRALFLFKYLKKGEINYLKQQFEQRNVLSEFGMNPIKRKQKQQEQLTHHNNISMFYSGMVNSRVKFNSQYSKRNNKKIISTSQQVTIDKQEFDYEPQALLLDDYILLDNLKEDIDIMNEGQKTSEINITQNLKTTKDGQGPLNSRQMVSPLGMMKIKHMQSCQKPKVNSELLQPRQPHSTNDVTAHIKKKDQPNFRVVKKNQEPMKEKKDTNNKKRKIQQPTATIDSLDSSLDGHKLLGNLPSQKKVAGDNEIDDFYSDLESSLDGDLESPLMPSMKFNYVLNANSSALSRKTYYKQLQKNVFEADYCAIIDCKTNYQTKIENLYKIYYEIQQSKDQQKMKDGAEIFAFLRLELENNDESVIFLRNEILYFQDTLHSKNESSTQLNKRNTMKSLDKGPLPAIRENDVEDFFAKSPSKNLKSTVSLNSRTPNKQYLHYYKRLQVNTVKVPHKQDIPRISHTVKQAEQLDLVQKGSINKINNLSVTVDQSQVSPKHWASCLPSKMIESQQKSEANSPVHPNFTLMQVSMHHRNNNTYINKKDQIIKTVGVSLIEKQLNKFETKNKIQTVINQQLSKNITSKSNTSSNYNSTPLAQGTHQMPPSNFFMGKNNQESEYTLKRSNSNLKHHHINNNTQNFSSSRQLNKSQVSSNMTETNNPQGSEIIVGGSRGSEIKPYISQSKSSALKQSLVGASIKSESNIKFRQPTSCKSSISSNNSKAISKRASMKK